MSAAIYAGRSEITRSPHWLAENSGWGSYRCTHQGPATSAISSTLVRVPPAQRSPWHGSGGWPELGDPFPRLDDGGFFLSLEGEVVFFAVGRAFVMKPRDVMVTNAAIYSYLNPGSDDSFFWIIRNRRRKPILDPNAQRWQGDPEATSMKGSHPYYATEPRHDVIPDAAARFRLVDWNSYRLGEITWSGTWGSLWGAYPNIDTGVRGRILRVPPAQDTVGRSLTEDCLLIGIGDTPLEVDVEGHVYTLLSGDSIAICGGNQFKLRNTSGQDTLVFEASPAT